jgi:hypothetical protein
MPAKKKTPQTIPVRSAAKSYTDYVVTYRTIKGTIKGCLQPLTFCNKIKQGKRVNVGSYSFIDINSI